MLKSIFKVLGGLLSFFKYPIIAVIGIIILFYILVFIQLIINSFKGRKLKKGSHQKLKKHGFFRKLFVDLPKQYTDDLLNRDPDFFPYQGLIIYEGRQRKWKNFNDDPRYNRNTSRISIM